MHSLTRYGITRLVLGAIVVLAWSPAFAQSRSIEGTWTGGGYAELADGQRERLRCRVRYTRVGANIFGVSAVCASPSVRVTQTGTVSRVAANRFAGDLYNPEYGVAGRVRIVVSGARQTVKMTSAQGSGALSLSR